MHDPAIWLNPRSCSNDNNLEDNRDRRHDDSSKSSRAGQFHQRRPDNAIHRRPDVLSKAKSHFNIFLNIPQPSYISMMFLRAVFSVFVLQIIFFHIYYLKHNIQLSLRQIPEQSCWCSDVSRDGPISGFSLHVHEHLPSTLWVAGSGSLVTLCFS